MVASVDALTASWIVIPAPSALEEVSPAPKFSVIFLSFTSKLVVFIVVVVPETVRSPEIVTLFENVPVPAVKADDPISIAPKPELIAPESNVPTVVICA